MRITQRLFISHVAAILIPTLALSVVYFINTRNALKATEIGKLESIADLKVKMIESVFTALKQDIGIAQSFHNIRINLPILIDLNKDESDPAYIKALGTLDGQLATVVKNCQLLRIKLLDVKGDTIYAFDGMRHYYAEDDNGVPAPPEKFLKGGGERFWLSEIYKWKSNFAMILAASLYDMENKHIGFLEFEIDMATIYKNIQDVTSLGKTGETIAGKRSGNSIIFLYEPRNDKDHTSKRGILIGGPFGIPIQKAVSGESGVGASIDYRNKKVLSAWRYVPCLDWGLVVKIDTDEAFAPIIWLRTYIIVFLVFIVTLALATSFSIAKAISNPIHELQKGAEIIGGGDLHYRVNINTKDEIGELSSAFNNMALNLGKYHDRVVRAEKLATIGLLASSVAHELRNPLGVMKNVVYYFNMLKLGERDPEIKDNLDIMSQEIEISDRIISDLLEFSRIKKPMKRPENINTLIKEVLDRTVKGSNIAVSYELADALPAIKVDAMQMRQVFFNMVKNAIESMGKNGRLIVKTVEDGGAAKVSFTDTGCGIPKENLDKIFEPLFSTKIKGTGLGLSICSSIVKAHDGEIEVESEAGKGATFMVKLPIERV